MFLPTTREEFETRKIKHLDVIIITGDAYIDSPYIGAAVIGRWLEAHGYHVGIIAQPDVDSPADITRLGEPSLFWGVTAGCVDSMVANYTSSGKFRKEDDYTPGGVNNRRPDRASMVYTNLIRRYYKNTVPIVLGGIEASLRRIPHYDSHDNKVRNSILFDSKADIILYGMAEKSVLELARRLKKGEEYQSIRGLATIGKTPPSDYLILPDAETVKTDKTAFLEMTKIFYQNTDPRNAKGLAQRFGERYLIINPPSDYETTEEMDQIHNMAFERTAHPYYSQKGEIRALSTIRFSIPTHRGCFGSCHFCAITVHQGRQIRSRSEDSIVKEAKLLTQYQDFKGYILDVGGPTANMYGMDCSVMERCGACSNKDCMTPVLCKNMRPSHAPLIRLLKKLRKLDGIKKVFVASGIRYDLILADSSDGKDYLSEIIAYHISGQLKIAPEHSVDRVLQLMGKQDSQSLLDFKREFDRLNAQQGKKQFLTYYFIAAHPGCTHQDMESLSGFIQKKLHIKPEQVQIFTPTPSTLSTAMYYTQTDPHTQKPLFVEKDPKKKEEQKQALFKK